MPKIQTLYKDHREGLQPGQQPRVWWSFVIEHAKIMLEAEQEAVKEEVAKLRESTKKKDLTLDEVIQQDSGADNATLHKRAVAMQE